MNCPKSFSLPISILEIVEISKQGMWVKNNHSQFELDSISIRIRFEFDLSYVFYFYRSLDPATTYQFRVCAVNSAGASDWSDLTEATTPPAAPAAVNGVHVREVSAISLTLAWHRPQSNGEHISHYNIDTGSATVISTSGPETYFTLDSLK